MVSTLIALGITLVLLGVILGLAYLGLYALVYLIPIVMAMLIAYVIYCVVKQTFFKGK